MLLTQGLLFPLFTFYSKCTDSVHVPFYINKERNYMLKGSLREVDMVII